MCDNEAVVAIVNQGSCRDWEAMHLMRCLAFIAAMFQLDFYAQHIKGAANMIADALSRDYMLLFRSLHPQACENPTPIPHPLLEVLLETKPDWSSRSWTQLWSDTFGRDWQSLPTSQPPDDTAAAMTIGANSFTVMWQPVTGPDHLTWELEPFWPNEGATTPGT
jgi:hypothetical protein